MTRHAKRWTLFWLVLFAVWFATFWQIKGHAEEFKTAQAGEVMK